MNKTQVIICRYVGKNLSFHEEFELSDLDKLELLMDLEETYHLTLDEKLFKICNTIQQVEDLLLKSKPAMVKAY